MLRASESDICNSGLFIGLHVHLLQMELLKEFKVNILHSSVNHTINKAKKTAYILHN